MSRLPASRPTPKAPRACASGVVSASLLGQRLSPYYAAGKQRQLLKGRFGEKALRRQEFPFLPKPAGKTANKKGAMTMARTAVKTMNEPTRTPGGQDMYGSHVFRVDGGRHLARARVQTPTIRVMARWGPPSTSYSISKMLLWPASRTSSSAVLPSGLEPSPNRKG